MDFAALPPEINSARMYAGPGAGPMLAAAAAWNGLAADLYSTATSYRSVIAGLVGESWRGPASTSMEAAAAPYVSWISATAAQCEQVAAQATAAVSAYEAAFAMTVPPPLIAANRAELVSLVATNFLGQNTPAIMATETQYGEMWAEDAGAMYGYAANSAGASTLTPFTPPAQTTNPAGLGGQAAAVAHTAGTAVGSHTQTALSLINAVPQALQAMAQPLPSMSSTTGNGAALAIGSNAGAQGLALDLGGLGLDAFGLAGPEGGGFAIEVAGTGVELAGVGGLPASGGFVALGSLGGLGSSAGLVAFGPSAGIAGAGPVLVSAGQAASVGGLSVPPSWTMAAPALRTVAAALPSAHVSLATEVLTGPSGNGFADMALAGMAGRALGSTASLARREQGGATTGKRIELPQRSTAGLVTGIAAELRELAALRDSGILTDEEFTEQKRRLLGH
jgi:PPE-repeat protein